MKSLQLNCCKKLSLIIPLILFIYYHNLSNTIDDLYQHLNATTKPAENLALNNESDARSSKRIKRFLIFQGGGVVKLVCGTSFPIIMADKKRSLNYFYNFQMQYTPPIIPLYWWSFYNTTTFVARTNKYKRSADMLIRFDKSRALVYDFIKTILKRSGSFGKECLLKVICEVARAPLNDELYETIPPDTKEDYGRNIYHKLVNAIFTPVHSNVDDSYINARLAGQNGANCNETFGECPIIDKLFERFTQFI